MQIQLLTFRGCSCASETRALLTRVLASEGVVESIEEIETAGDEIPTHLGSWGSPTILIDGADIARERAQSGMSCRLYRLADGRFVGVPPRELILSALRRAIR